MNTNFENLNYDDGLKKIEERIQFIDIIIEEQEKYPTESLEGQSFKLAVAAITFSIVVYNEYAIKMSSESIQKKMAEFDRMAEREYKENYSCEKDMEDDISLKDAPKMLACLKELLQKHEKGTEVFAALQCSLKDIEMAMSQEERFSVFLKSI